MILSYPIYDTALFGTTANTTHQLFTVAQGGSSTKGQTITNMRGNSQFPQQEKFTIKRVGITIDDVLSDDDIQGLFYGSIFTVIYNNTNVLQVPSAMCSYRNSVSGVKTEATASAFDFFGLEGDGYMLDKPLEVQGGKQFRAELIQALAVDSANLDIKVILFGDLDAPSISP